MGLRHRNEEKGSDTSSTPPSDPVPLLDRHPVPGYPFMSRLRVPVNRRRRDLEQTPDPVPRDE